MADTIPIYSLYALLFLDTGLSDAQISSLFIVWSMASVVAEVPSGALADRFSRRSLLVTAGLLQAAAYTAWTAAPGYAAFAVGFVLWGLGSACSSGALEALLYDSLASLGAEEHYARLRGRVGAAGLLAQIPAAIAATFLFSVGGYAAVGWASVACCLAGAALAARLHEARREEDRPARSEDGGPSYLVVLRSGLAEAVKNPLVRTALIAVALLGGLDGLDEYFPLLAESGGVRPTLVPITVLGVFAETLLPVLRLGTSKRL